MPKITKIGRIITFNNRATSGPELLGSETFVADVELGKTVELKSMFAMYDVPREELEMAVIHCHLGSSVA